MNAVCELEQIQRPTIQVISCSKCGEIIPLDTPEHAIAMTDNSSIEIFKWADRAKLHLVKMVTGEVLICMFSLDH